MESRGRARRLPIAGLAGCALTGSTAACLPQPWQATALLICLLGLLYVTRQQPLASRTALPLIGLLYYLHTWSSLHPGDATALSQQVRDREHIVLQGILSGEPTARPGWRPQQHRWSCELTVDRLYRTDQWQTASGRVQLVWTTTGDEPVPVYGDRVEVSGVLEHRSQPGYGLTLTRSRCKAAPRVLSSGHGNPLLAWAIDKRQKSSAQLGLGLDDFPDETGIYRAMLLGYRQQIPEAANQRFRDTGTLHLFAISGLHVGIFALLLASLLKTCRVPRTVWILFLAPFLLGFLLTTGMKASAIRAGIMASLYFLAPFCRQRPDARASLSIAVLLILGIAPHQILDIGFQLSFMLVAGILTLQPPIARGLTRLHQNDPWAPPEYAARRSYRWWKSLSAYLALTTAAWLTALPLTAFYFQQISPAGLVGNPPAGLFAFGIVTSGVCSLLFGLLHPELSEICNFCSLTLIRILDGWTRILSNLPGARIPFPALPWILIPAWYAMLSGIGSFRKYGCLSLAAACFLIAGGARWFAAEREPVLHAWDTGTPGYLISGHGDHTLIDPGSAYRLYHLLSFLKKQGITHLDRVILTHADAKHISALPDLLQRIRVDELWVPANVKQTTGWKKTLAAVSLAVRELHPGDHGHWPSGDWEVLHPGPTAPSNRADDQSLVLRLQGPHRTLLLCGGLGQPGEAAIMNQAGPLVTDILAIGAPSQPPVATPAWLDRTRPRILLIPEAALRDGHRHNQELIDRLEQLEIPQFRLTKDPVSIGL